MTQIKIEVPANDTLALSALGEALSRIASERGTQGSEVTRSTIRTVGDTSIEDKVTTVEPVTPPEVEFTEEQAINHIGNANDNPMDSTLDKDGLPWDGRIHSKGKTRLADDTWRLKKRPNDKDENEWLTFVENVKSELKAVQDITIGDVQPEHQLEGVTPNGDLAVDTTVTPPVDTVTPPVDTVTPPVDIVTPPVDTVTPPVDDSITDFGKLMQFVTSNNDKLPLATVNAELVKIDPSLISFGLLATRKDLIPLVHTKLKELL